MYTFPDDLRKAYVSSPLSFVYYQNIDDKAVPVLASAGFCTNTGMSQERALEWLKTGMFERMHPDDVGIVARISDEFLHQRGTYDVIFRTQIKPIAPDINAAPEYVLMHGLGKWQTMPDGTDLAVITYANLTHSMDILHSKMDEYDLLRKDQFYTDSLTGLPNINYLHKYGNEKIDMIRADGRTPMVVYSDVEAMQSYNNQYGITEGDKLLRLITRTLQEFFPKALVTRGADDHFIMLTGFDDREFLAKQLEVINEKIRKEAKGNTSGLRSGVAPVDKDAVASIEQAIDHAKHALKRLESNLNLCVGFFSQEADDTYWKNRYIVENFDRALENDWIKLYYQAIHRVESQKAAAFEGLARWIDPSRGMISPGEFIPVLQKYHLLYKLDLYMFEQACKEIGIRNENGLPLLPVSINFSRQDFDHADIVGEMNRIYEKYELDQYVDKSYFIVEITEQDVAVGADQFREQLKSIRENGYSLWLDDFGSGYSAINMFSQFEFDLIKYDMDLLRHLDDHGGVNRLILKELVYVSRKLGIHTLVEGLETEEQLTFVKEIGCELAQGFYFTKPESMDEILFRIKNGGSIKVCEPREERELWKKKWLDNPEEQQEKEYQTYSYLTHALSQDYIFLYYVNLDTGHYTEYSADQAHEELDIDGEGVDFFYACRENAKEAIYPEDQTMVMESLTKENVLDSINKTGAYKLTYRLMMDGKPVFVGLKATKAKDNENHLIIGVTNVDVQMQLKEAQQRVAQEQSTTARIAALFGDLICIDVVDLETDHYQEYSTYQEHAGMGLAHEGDDFFVTVMNKMRELVHPDDLPVVEASFSKDQMLNGIRQYGIFEMRYRLVLESEHVHTHLKAIIKEENGREFLLVGLTNINSVVKRENEYAMNLSEARNQANKDALTGVKNRNAYLSDVEELNSRITNESPVQFAVAVCDVNNLKQVNDVYGHQAGDAYIKKACYMVCDIFDHSPVYRVGGDEFAAIVQGRDYSNLDELISLLEEINQKHKASGDVVVSCGVAYYAQGKKVEDVFAEADQNMYEEKKRLKGMA